MRKKSNERPQYQIKSARMSKSTPHTKRCERKKKSDVKYFSIQEEQKRAETR